jgi:hypothetical protein
VRRNGGSPLGCGRASLRRRCRRGYLRSDPACGTDGFWWASDALAHIRGLPQEQTPDPSPLHRGRMRRRELLHNRHRMGVLDKHHRGWSRNRASERLCPRLRARSPPPLPRLASPLQACVLSEQEARVHAVCLEVPWPEAVDQHSNRHGEITVLHRSRLRLTPSLRRGTFPNTGARRLCVSRPCRALKERPRTRGSSLHALAFHVTGRA